MVAQHTIQLVLRAAVVGAVGSSLAVAIIGMVIPPFEPLVALAFACLSLIYTIPASLVIGVPLFVLLMRFLSPSPFMVVVSATIAGALWAKVSEWQSAKPGFIVIGTGLGAIGGLCSYAVLLRSNNSLERTRGG